MMDDEINEFKSTKIEQPIGDIDFTYEIRRRVREEEDNFIFETIEPYCSKIAQQKISKKELESAIRLWMVAKRYCNEFSKEENNAT